MSINHERRWGMNNEFDANNCSGDSKEKYVMNLRFVEAFYWVATLKSVSRAAEKLFLTQSAMSARIAALEDELGTLLLDRRDKQFRLTVAGTRFVSYAQKLLEMQREIKA